jgi:hypothetical protein
VRYHYEEKGGYFVRKPKSGAHERGRNALTALQRTRLSSWGLRCKRELHVQQLGTFSTLDLALIDFGQVKIGEREPPRYIEGIIRGMCSVPTPKEPMKSIDFVCDLPGMARARDWYKAKFWRTVLDGYSEEPSVSSAIEIALDELGYERMSCEGSNALYREAPGSDRLRRAESGEVGRAISFERSLVPFAADVLRRKRQQGWIELLYVLVLLHIERVLNRDTYGCLAVVEFAERFVRGPLATRLLGKHAKDFRAELTSLVFGFGAIGTIIPRTLHADPLQSSRVIVPLGSRDGQINGSLSQELLTNVWGIA